MTWAFEATALVDGVFVQTLPEGWAWDASSLGKLTSSSSLYTSTSQLSADGRTLTATISVPGTGLVEIGGLKAVPAATVPNGSVYEPVLEATDATTTHRGTGSALTVVNVPQVVLSLNGANRMESSYDFGAGDEPAVGVAVNWGYSARSELPGQRMPLELGLPHRITMSYDGPTPDAVVPCTASGMFEIVSVAQGRIELDLLQPPDGTPIQLCLWYKSEGLPTTAQDADTISVTSETDQLRTTDGSEVVRDGGDGPVDGLIYDEADQVVPPQPADVSAAAGAWRWQSGPAGPTLPAPLTTAGGWRLTDTVAFGATTLHEATYTPASDKASRLAIGAEDLTGYQFWDPSKLTLLDDPDAIYVGQHRRSASDRGVALDPSSYVLEYTTTARTTDPADANTWYPSIEAAGGAAVIAGVRVRYVAGAWAQGMTIDTDPVLMKFAVPLVAVSATTDAYGTAEVTHVWTATDESDIVRMSTLSLRHLSFATTLSVDPSQIVSGSPLTYTVITEAAPDPTRPPTMPDYTGSVELTITLPTNVTDVDLSAAEAAGWVLVSETAADLGADGMPGTADDGIGAVLVFRIPTATVTADLSAGLPQLPLAVTTSLRAPDSRRTVAKVSGALLVTQPVPLTLTSGGNVAVSVLQAETLTMEGSTSTPRIAATQDTVEWSVRWFNYTTRSQDTETYVLDVLPFAGDSRGTSTGVTLTLASANLTGSALTDGVIEVTSALPGTIGVAPGAGATWTELTESTDLSTVTAVRVRLPSLAVGASGGLDLTMRASGHSAGDLLVNSASSATEGSSLTLVSGDVPVEVIGSTIAGRVVLDTDPVGTIDPGDLPATGVAVRLVPLAGGTTLDTVTDADGGYSFDGLHAGDYRVEVLTSTIAGASVAATVDPDGTLDAVTLVTLDGGQNLLGVDFAFAVRNPDLALTVQPGAGTGNLVAGDEVTFTYTLTNTGDTPLVGVGALDDLDPSRSGAVADWPGAAGELAPGESATITVTYTVDQADLDAGMVTTTVDASGTDELGNPVSAPTVVGRLSLPSGAALMLSGEGTLPDTIATGETVTWSVVVANTGATTVSGIELVDALEGMSDYAITWPAGSGSRAAAGQLAPGEQAVATATSALTQEQVDAGTAVARPSATGTAAPAGDEVGATLTIPVSFAVPGAVTLHVQLDGADHATEPGLETLEGTALEWTYVVTNTGIATLHDVAVTDSTHADGEIVAPVGFTGTLAAGESVTFTAGSAAEVGTWSVRASVTATPGTSTTSVIASDVVWYTATAPVVTDPGAGGEPPTATGTCPSTSQVLAVTGAGVAGVAVLAVMFLVFGGGLVRLRSRREEGEEA
jgi:hypothetical protein